MPVAFYSSSHHSSRVRSLEFAHDTDISSIPVDILRSIFGYVGQEPVLFATSIRNNLRYGQTDPDAITDAPTCWSSLIRCLKNLTHMWARARAARSVAVRNRPQILLLDEATSAIDNDSEKLVLRR